jgi:N-formylglutamate amidohydrolase
MSEINKLQEALALAGRPGGNPRWWLAPSGDLKPCSEHEYAAREILRVLGVIPAPGRKLYDQMFDHGWVRVVGEKNQIHFEVSRTHSKEAPEAQLRALRALALECGYELYDATAKRAVVFERNDQAPVPPQVIVHVPHSSRLLPDDARASILLSDEALDHELLRMTDAFTDEVFQLDSSIATPVIFLASRLAVDVERFADDRRETMAAKGMGCVYTRSSSGELLRQEGDSQERERLVAEYYHPHHQKLTNAVQAALDHWGSALIIDAHSFSSKPLRHELDQSPDRPDVCIGTDQFHTPPALADEATRLFRQAGFETEVNRPFSGALVPSKFYRTDGRVSAIMIEINRKTYMNEETGERLKTFEALCRRVQDVLHALIRTTL